MLGLWIQVTVPNFLSVRDSNSGPHACRARAPIHWTLSPTSHLVLNADTIEGWMDITALMLRHLGRTFRCLESLTQHIRGQRRKRWLVDGMRECLAWRMTPPFLLTTVPYVTHMPPSRVSYCILSECPLYVIFKLRNWSSMLQILHVKETLGVFLRCKSYVWLQAFKHLLCLQELI